VQRDLAAKVAGLTKRCVPGQCHGESSSPGSVFFLGIFVGLVSSGRHSLPVVMMVNHSTRRYKFPMNNALAVKRYPCRDDLNPHNLRLKFARVISKKRPRSPFSPWHRHRNFFELAMPFLCSFPVRQAKVCSSALFLQMSR
jgi:hypothetical protein